MLAGFVFAFAGVFVRREGHYRRLGLTSRERVQPTTYLTELMDSVDSIDLGVAAHVVSPIRAVALLRERLRFSRVTDWLLVSYWRSGVVVERVACSANASPSMGMHSVFVISPVPL